MNLKNALGKTLRHLLKTRRRRYTGNICVHSIVQIPIDTKQIHCTRLFNSYSPIYYYIIESVISIQ